MDWFKSFPFGGLMAYDSAIFAFGTLIIVDLLGIFYLLNLNVFWYVNEDDSIYIQMIKMTPVLVPVLMLRKYVPEIYVDQVQCSDTYETMVTAWVGLFMLGSFYFLIVFLNMMG
jgi:ABC-type amino acid transport system permease subunit